jgi:hypothetical protein
LGLFDIFTGGSGAQKALRLKSKIVQKYGEPSGRQKAMEELGKMQIPEAVSVLMSRFTVAVEPGTIDADEKDHVLELVTGFGKMAVEPVLEFLRRNDAASSWAVRILEGILPEPEVVSCLTAFLAEIGPKYMRDPEKKVVVIQYLAGKDDPRIAEVLTPVLDDMSDDVKIAALSALGPLKYEPAREPILKLLVGEETGKRVQKAALDALATSGFGVQGFREKVESRMVDPYSLDKSGVIQKRA